MSLHNLTAAARIAGVSRSTMARAVRSGKISTTINDQGERCVDRSELIRVFGPLKGVDRSEDQPLSSHGMVTDPLVDLLREQLRLAEEREQQATERERERERESRERESRLLALLEAEQQARRELETKLLPAPMSALAGKGRLWALAILLLVALAALVVSLVHPEFVERLTGG